MARPFNEIHRHGSARWADDRQIRAAGLLGTRGVRLGTWKDRPLSIEGDAPLITIGGAGSGKLRDVLAYTACASPGQRALFLDPRGEIAARPVIFRIRGRRRGIPPASICQRFDCAGKVSLHRARRRIVIGRTHTPQRRPGREGGPQDGACTRSRALRRMRGVT